MEPDLQSQNDADAGQGSLGPWAFLKASLPGGLHGAALQLILAWVAFQGLVSGAWALHLKALAGWSGLPRYWGEQLTARDVWELVVNGGLGERPLDLWTGLLAVVCLIWALWSGWRVQAHAAEVEPRFAPWGWALLDALLLGVLPNALLAFLLTRFLGFLASTGIQGLGWTHLVLGTVVRLTALSAFLLQWWLCRANRAASKVGGWRLGSWGALFLHLWRSFLRLWLHPIQWTALLVGGLLVRLGLHAVALGLAWRWGGGSSVRVWAFLLLQLFAAAGAAWFMGWMLRVVGRFWHHDAELQREIARLKGRAMGVEHG
ncbi:MAG: hypothetical protein LWX11_11370 [Firmicutes bacterium]|nr:hypothetical protein [Bacillota bacterium]